MSLTPPITGNDDLDSFLYNIALGNVGGGVPGVVSGDPRLGYEHRYLHLKYADDNQGTNISNIQTGKTHYGLLNSSDATESSNPLDYTWFETENGFLSDYKVWYKLLGGRRIDLQVSILSPDATDAHYLFDNNDGAIDLDANIIIGEDIVDDPLTVGQLLALLENEITETQLFSDLGSRIDLIDGDEFLTNSVAYRVAQEALARDAAIAVESLVRQTADESIASDITLITSSIADNAAAIVTEQTARSNADTALATSITSLTSVVGDNAAAIETEATTRASADEAISTNVTTLFSRVDTADAAIVTEQTARSTADTALASDITILSSTVGDNTAAIEVEATTRSDETGNLFGKYTVKVDLNGYVSGFGLASEANDGTTVSDFQVRADRFAIASPSGPSITPSVPFIVYTTSQNITTPSGEIITVDPGVYIRNANIEYVTADQIDTRGLTIKDASGTVIFASGTPLTSSYITPDSGWLNSGVSIASDGTLSGAGGGQVTVDGLDDSIVRSANPITEDNISTYISGAAIDTAQIKDAAIKTALIDVAQIDTLRIGANQVTIPSGSTGGKLASTVVYNQYDIQYIIICTFTQGTGSSGTWTLYANNVPLRSVIPATYTTGALSDIYFAAADSTTTFKISTNDPTGDAECGITVLGAMR